MSETSNKQKPTPAPGRRRQNRRNPRTAGQRAYASENDLGFVDPTRFADAPKTPEKMAAASPAQASSAAKQRSRPKSGRSKNAGTSPESEFPPQHLTPDHPGSIKITSHTAFAGATFHASPAPSALPMPSFFSKPTGSPAFKEPENVVQQPSPPATDTEVATPSHPSTSAKPTESPLDFMFRAHRQERERQRQATPGSNATPPTFPSLAPNTFPKTSSLPHTRPVPVRTVSSGAMDHDELDGTSGQPLGPSFATPYQERIKAARSGNNRQTSTQATQHHFAQPQPAQQVPADDPTEALKKFLFGGASKPPPAPSQIPPMQHELPGSSAPLSPPQVKGIGHHYQAQAQPPGPNIQAMENDLRRILKLDSGPATTGADRRLFTS